MTSEELLQVIGLVDDGLIQEAQAYLPPVRASRRPLWRALAGGLAAACLVVAILFHLPAAPLSSSGSTADSTTAGAPAQPGEGNGSAQEEESSVSDGGSSGTSSSGAAQDILHTPEGAYILTGETVSTLPQDSRQLGVLFFQGEDSQTQLYTGRREYAGCMLWEGPDGILYVQLPGGGYALAQPQA